MTAAWVLIVTPLLAFLDAATGHRARELWSGVPAWVDRRLAARCDLGGED